MITSIAPLAVNSFAETDGNRNQDALVTESDVTFDRREKCVSQNSFPTGNYCNYSPGIQ